MPRWILGAAVPMGMRHVCPFNYIVWSSYDRSFITNDNVSPHTQSRIKFGSRIV